MNNGDIKKRKLVLKCETVVPLQSVDLDRVAGGNIFKLAYEGIKLIGNLYNSYQATRDAADALRNNNNNNGGGRDMFRSHQRMTGGECV